MKLKMFLYRNECHHLNERRSLQHGKNIISCTSARDLVSGIYKELKIKLKVKEHNQKNAWNRIKLS